MKSNFDLTPIARNGANAFVARICMCALLVAVPLWLWQRSAFAHGVLCGVLAGGLRFRYYPSLAGAPVTPMTVSFFVVYFLLCLTPAALDLAATRQWRQIEKEVRR